MENRKKITAVLFDCDGLMFNTERLSMKRWTRAAEERGLTLPKDFFLNITGKGRGEGEAYLTALKQQSSLWDDLVTTVRKQRFDLDYFKALPEDSLNMPGLPELCSYLREQNIAMAAASSSPKDYVKTLLDTTSVDTGIHTIAAREDVTDSKPAPDIFLKAAEMLDVLPSECIVLEDSEAGILAGRRAGMFTIFVEDTIPLNDTIRKNADLITSSLNEVLEYLKENL